MAVVNDIVQDPAFDTIKEQKLDGELKGFHRRIQPVTREELSDVFPELLDGNISVSLPKSGIGRDYRIGGNENSSGFNNLCATFPPTLI